MKVVLFCGGLGTRIRESSEGVPKPMVTIGHRPLLWHLMKYYAHFGHNEFILCLGYRGDVIKQYFLNYDECLSNDFSLSAGGHRLQLYNRDLDDWTITFVDTGLHANIGERLRAVEPHLGDDDVFLANYADGLSDLDLPSYLAEFRRRDRIGIFLSVRPGQSFHVVATDEEGLVRDIRHVSQSALWINGGFFAFKRTIFDYMEDGEELVEQPFQRLIAEGQLMSCRSQGFWQCMDTFKDRQLLEDLSARGAPPWEVWRKTSPPTSVPAPASLAVLEPNGRRGLPRPAAPRHRAAR
jgi:glucose-1-phosphate cytidylyltransferase